MKQRYLYLVFLCCVFIILFCPNAFTKEKLTEKQALNVLVLKIEKDQLYSGWTSLSCLSFLTEEKTINHFDFGIHEKHGGKCPGDPSTYPIVDRFRVDRSTKTIYWYDPTLGDFVSYKEVLKIRNK